MKRLPTSLLALALVGCGSSGGGSSGSSDSESSDSGSSDSETGSVPGSGDGHDTTGGSHDGGDSSHTDDGSDDSTTEADTEPPTISNVLVTPNPANHLAVEVTFDTNEPTTSTLTTTNHGDHEWTLGPGDASSLFHHYYVLGLRPEEAYDFVIDVEDEGGNGARDDSASYTPGPLPENFPPLAVTSTPADMAPGLTLFHTYRWGGFGPDPTTGVILAVDAEGRVVWYLRQTGVSELKLLPNGNLIYVRRDDEIREIATWGNDVFKWMCSDLTPPMDSFHHEVLELPESTLLGLSSELRSISGYPPNGATYNVVGDVIVNFDRDGTVVETWSLLDILEDYQLRVIDQASFNSPFWDSVYNQAPNGTKDWSHSNGLEYDQANDLILVSVRHHDWIVAFERETGQLAWRLGAEGDFAMQGAGTWFYHQHAPELQEDGSLLIYDNGNMRPGTGFGPGDEPPYSRAVIVSFDSSDPDPANWTAQVEWEYTHDSPYVFAPFIGDADRLSNGNILIADGGLVSNPAQNIMFPSNHKMVRLVEVTADGPATVVFLLEIDDASSAGWSAYRAERIPLLRGQVVEGG